MSFIVSGNDYQIIKFLCIVVIISLLFEQLYEIKDDKLFAYSIELLLKTCPTFE